MPNGEDLERRSDSTALAREGSESAESGQGHIAIVVSDGESVPNSPEDLSSSPKKKFLAMNDTSEDECRVCQQEKDEALIDLGCHCRGALAKSHKSCIETWFRVKGSNRCEICQEVAKNVSAPESQPITNYWVWRIDQNARSQNQERGCFSPLWVAFSILIGGLLLDVLISITLGVSALPVNIIIGVIVVLGLGTALRLALEFCHEWSLRRSMQRTEANVGFYHPPI